MFTVGSALFWTTGIYNTVGICETIDTKNIFLDSNSYIGILRMEEL